MTGTHQQKWGPVFRPDGSATIAATSIPEARLIALMRDTGMGRVQAYRHLRQRDALARRCSHQLKGFPA